MKNTLITIFLVNLLALDTFSQHVKSYDLDSIIVSSNRIPKLYRDVGRNIQVLSKNEFNLLPSMDIQNLLENSTGIDVKQRGPGGIQADISIRGGSFEHSLVLIDGIRLSDPQTGHHNMNLPISLTQIDRIEILKGQGSRIYGANAFNGVINIIPKTYATNKLHFNASGGENNFFELGIDGSYKIDNSHHIFSISKSKSDGYRSNTEFDNYGFSMNNSFIFKKSVIKSLFGYTFKDFGANSYYSIRFPEQGERIKTLLSAVSTVIEFNDFTLQSKIYWRKNEDEFVLIKSDPSFYKNDHETNVYGGDLQFSTSSLGGSTCFGIEYTQDDIESNNLGNHNRIMKGFFIEQIVDLSKRLSLSIGGFVNYYSQIDWKFWPGIDVAFQVSDQLKLFSNYGRAFRIPTYTELYYSDPVTLGNSDLRPEESDNYEVGFNYYTGIMKIIGSYFRKEGKNLIDYVLQTNSEVWKAQNFTRLNTDGFELGLSFDLRESTDNIIDKFKVDYTYLYTDKSDLGMNSRYVLEHLIHDFTINMFHNLPFGINQSWTINYEDRINLGDHFTIDTKLSKSFSIFNVFLIATNILNEPYEEIPGVTLPGRWIIGGIKLVLF